MKLLNYDKRTLIMRNVKTMQGKMTPETFTLAQYDILCKLIRRHQISESSFRLVITSLFNQDDWRKLNYQQMYELIHVLTYWNYEKVRLSE